MTKEYFGLDVFDLKDVIVKNRDKILRKKPLKEHRIRMSQFNEKHKHEIFDGFSESLH
jgi:hypothetical protein